MANGERLTGWRLIYGFKNRHANDLTELSDYEEDGPPQISERGDDCCTQEQCGSGCYVATVDYDRLDQQ